MKFIYFTDIHLCQGTDSETGVEKCFESMLNHNPRFLINGGDLGITPEAISFYTNITRDLSVPLFLCNGNHEMCSGYMPREKAGTMNASIDIDVFDGSPKTRVTVPDIGPLPGIDPHAEASKKLCAHLYELPANFDRQNVNVQIAFENNQTFDLVLSA